ncbi:CaiB/BaiF CoA transferase family protein [Actinomadura sp. NTSP31]|uniref:CaiB/BaiF CoA transferase family protein n=1 Tax=Actinomadura sp. NTSP31 TaxID=1735447 RepID=UPI0035BFDF9E
MSVTGEPGGEGTKAGVALVDVVTGLHAATGVLAALRHRDRTGEGQHVEVSLLSSLLSALTNQASAYVAAGAVPKAMGNRHPSIVPYEVFPAADRAIVIAAGNDRQYRALCTVLGREDLAADPRYATNTDRVANREALVEALSETLRTRTADEWFTAISDAGVPCGPINDLAEAFDLGTRLGLAPAVRVDDPRRDRPADLVTNPIRLTATPPAYRLAPPRLGEDDTWVREILDR